jgi:hypothetical protein
MIYTIIDSLTNGQAWLALALSNEEALN